MHPESMAVVVPQMPDVSKVEPNLASDASKPEVAPTEGAVTKSQTPPAVDHDVISIAQPLQAPRVPATPSRPKPKPTLIKAVKEGNLALIEELLQNGHGLEELGMWDNTPLLVACTHGHSKVALLLIARKANIAAKNEHGATPLHYAAVEGNESVIEALIAAARHQDSEQGAGKLVSCTHAKVYNRHLDSYAQRTPLCSAAESGFSNIVGMLIAAGAATEEASDDGRTALWLACRHSRVSTVKVLLQHGVDTSAKDAQGISVLGAASIGCNEELVFALLIYGVADVNDTNGSPLRDAVRAGKRAVVEALLTHGAAVHPETCKGTTPLHAACEKSDEHIVRLLVRSRADPSIEDEAGFTAFDLLRRRGYADGQIVTLLKTPSISNGGCMDGSTGGCDTDDVLC